MLGEVIGTERGKRSGMNVLICSNMNQSQGLTMLNCIKHTKVLKEVTDRFKRDTSLYIS